MSIAFRFLLLCAILLALPTIADAQPVPLTVERVWTRDASGNDKTIFAPGEVIQFAAQLNNSYGGALLGAPLTITTPFYNNTKTIDIPAGRSTWTWNTTAPSGQGNYTITVKAYDSFYGVWATSSANSTAAVLSIQLAYVTDSADKTKTSFRSGENIHYHLDATNSSGQTISVSVRFSTSIDNLGKNIIIDKTFNLTMPTGLSRFYTPSVVPSGGSSGTYKLNGVIFQNSANNSTAWSSGFSVTHIPAYPLNVPLYSQFWGNENPNSYHEDCGPTAVAMAVNYYMDWHDTPAERIGKVRGLIAQGPTKNSTRGTNASELEFALSSIDQTAYDEILWLDQNKNPVPFPSVVSQIQTATGQGYPVVAFVDGTALGRGPNYGGHWFVITGISGDGQTVYVNDPDSDFARGPGFTLKISDYQNVATSDGAKNQNQPYGIIVKGPTKLTSP